VDPGADTDPVPDRNHDPGTGAVRDAGSYWIASILLDG
jgi:hypothetical protein